MNRTIALLLSLGMAVAGIAWASAGDYAPGEMDYARVDPALHVTNSAPNVTSISLSAPDVTVIDSTVDYQAYQLFGIPGEPFDMDEGHPAIPQITRLYRIPNTGSVDLVVGQSACHMVEGVNPFPIQWEKDTFDGTLTKSRDIYENNGWFPPSVAHISQPMIMRDFRVVSVTIYPVQVNPVTGQARVYDDLNVDIVTNDTPGENELLNPRQPSGAFRNVYRGVIANLDDNALDGFTDTPGSYMILCQNNATVLAWADTLATWKRRMGYDVVIDARSNWSSATMRQAIRDGYNNWDPPLEFACILGDVGQSGVLMPTGGGQYDHFFALMQDGDDLEDIGVGRMSAENSSQFSVIMAKTLGYERTPYMADPMWFHRAFLHAGYAGNVRSNQLCMLWGRRQFEHFTGVDSVYVIPTPGSANCSLIGQFLTAGISFFEWRGTVVGEMACGCESQGAASFKLPVSLTITCGSGDFDLSSGPSITECWLRAGTASAPKGGVCGIGTATYNTHVPYNNTVAGGLIYGICNLGIENLGLALAAAKYQLHAAWPNDQQSINFSNWNNLMGEPSLSMWTDQPVVMDVTYPSTVNVGTRRIQPQVTDDATGDPVENALVVLWKGNESYARALTDAGGFADVPVTVNTAGTMTITVTKRNGKPYLGDITCVPAERMVTHTYYSYDDDNLGGTSGNDDGYANPNEVIDVPIYLKNFGTSLQATNISAQLTTNNSNVVVVTGTESFPNLQPGDSATSAVPFRISIDPQMGQNERAVLTLAIMASGEQTHSAIELRCRAGNAVYVSQQVTGGDGDARLEPNETANLRVTIRNDGQHDMPQVNAVLISNSSFVAVLQNAAPYGNIAIGQSVTNTSNEFTLRANTLVYPGTQAAMMMVLTANNGAVDTVTFNVPIGFITSTDPTGPDAFGYYAYDNTDDSVEFHHEFAYVDIHTTGTNLNLNDPGEQTGLSPTFTSVRHLPFPFVFYGQSYDTISICSNGWAAFGNQGDLDLFRNYPIPGEQAPDAMLAIFWDDLKTTGTGNGVWENFDAANHRYIIQWKATGWAGGDANIHEDFEIVLLDPAFYPTRDSSGIVLFQYQDVTDLVGDSPDVQYSTIGICAPGCIVGLQYRFDNVAASGGATLVDGRCITFTTASRAAFGQIAGHVLDAANNQPMPGVVVSVDGHNDQTTTDASGNYTLEDVLIGTYTIRAHKFGYNDGVADNVVVQQDSTEPLNFSMLHPQILLSTDSIHVSLPDEPQETSLRLTNNGNGPLDYQITYRYVAEGGQQPDPWDSLLGINVTQLTSDYQIQGCEFIGDYWWATGGGGPNGQKMFYRFNLDGSFHDMFPQPSTTPFGWFDMAYDGNLVYGSDGPGIFGVDQSGVIQDTIPSPCNPTRAIAYDPQSDHFWVADFLSDIYEISRTGAQIRRFSNTLPITGLAWNVSDPDGYKLYAFHQDSSFQHAKVTRIHPVSGDRQFLVTLQNRAGDRSGGCAITPAWNSTMLVFGGIMQNSGGDRIGIWELAFNTTWITITPMIASVPANSWRDVSIMFDPTTLRNSTYRVDMTIHDNSVDSSLIVPVVLHVDINAAHQPPTEMPKEYALFQNYPNPFNGATTFRFDLKQAGMTSLRIYNLLGQEVATVVNGVMEAGSHSIDFDMNSMASGVYLYRLESGGFTNVRKLVLMK